jgi:AcrR family transcriptional regulator
LSQAPPETTRQRVLRVADSLFAAHGYAAVSMREVATAAGVTKPALYYHFRDKEALFEECILAYQHRLGELIREAASGEQPLAGRVSAVARVLLSGSPHHPVRAQADVAEHLPADARQRVGRSWSEHFLTPVTRVFEDARPELREGVDPAHASMALLGVSLAYLPPPPAREAAAADVGRPGAAGAPPSRPDAEAGLIAELVLRGVKR